jgi:hypothetical protein
VSFFLFRAFLVAVMDGQQADDFVFQCPGFVVVILDDVVHDGHEPLLVVQGGRGAGRNASSSAATKKAFFILEVLWRRNEGASVVVFRPTRNVSLKMSEREQKSRRAALEPSK